MVYKDKVVYYIGLVLDWFWVNLDEEKFVLKNRK